MQIPHLEPGCAMFERVRLYVVCTDQTVIGNYAEAVTPKPNISTTKYIGRQTPLAIAIYDSDLLVSPQRDRKERRVDRPKHPQCACPQENSKPSHDTNMTCPILLP